MLNDTFYLDGVSAESVGIRLQGELTFSAPVPNVEKVAVMGRNGDVLFESGTYANRTGKASCYCLNAKVQRTLESVNGFLLSKGNYRRLETSSDPDHFWLARVQNGAEIAHRKNLLAPFDIVFDCKPQKFLKSGEKQLTFAQNSVLYNATQNVATPLIVVYGFGDGVLQINDKVVRLTNMSGSLTLDCENQNAYNENGNQNSNIYAPEFPILEVGDNNIYFADGVSRVDIYPRWWDL